MSWLSYGDSFINVGQLIYLDKYRFILATFVNITAAALLLRILKSWKAPVCMFGYLDLCFDNSWITVLQYRLERA